MKKYAELGFEIFASKGTKAFLEENGVEAGFMSFEDVKKEIEEKEDLFLINTPKAMNMVNTDSFPLRRAAIERNLPVLTCLDTAKIFAIAIEEKQKGTALDYNPL